MPTFLLIRDVPSLIAWSLVIGLVQASFFPVGTALLLDLVPPERRQRALAFNYSVVSVGYTVAVAPAVSRGRATILAATALSGRRTGTAILAACSALCTTGAGSFGPAALSTTGRTGP